MGCSRSSRAFSGDDVVTLPVDPAALFAFVLAFVRASAWLVVAPPFSNGSVPAMAKVGIAAGLALAALHGGGAIPFSMGTFLAALLIQVATGVALGLLVSVLFSAVEAAGNVIGLFGGFALPPSLDPLSLNDSPALGQFYQLLATMLLFALGGEGMLVRGFVGTFSAVGWTLSSAGSYADFLTHDVAIFFSSALEMAAPMVVVLFLAQGVLGVLAKASPQMNVFSFAFPFQILLTLLLVVSSVTVLPSYVGDLITRGLHDAATWAHSTG